jgi:hypothetical protein
VKILTIPFPFQLLIERLASIAFLERLADAQTTRGWVMSPNLVIEPADPAVAQVILTVSPQHRMDLIDQLDRAPSIVLVARPSVEFDKIADRKCIGPKISPALMGSPN